MIVKLRKDLFDYLNDSLLEEQKVVHLKPKEIRKENQYVIIEIDEASADELRDWTSEKLQERGFDENYELTLEGKILEELLDAFYIG